MVQVKFLKHAGCYNPLETAWFDPERAALLVKSKQAEYVETPKKSAKAE